MSDEKEKSNDNSQKTMLLLAVAGAFLEVAMLIIRKISEVKAKSDKIKK